MSVISLGSSRDTRDEGAFKWIVVNDPDRSHRTKLPARATEVAPLPQGKHSVWVVVAAALMSIILMSLAYAARMLRVEDTRDDGEDVRTVLPSSETLHTSHRNASTVPTAEEETSTTTVARSSPTPIVSEVPTPYSLAATSEDCLHLNIWSPVCDLDEVATTCLSGCTVMVYFYGGELRTGANSLPFLDGRYLAVLGRVLVVVPNYRVGVFGFPSHPILEASRNPGFQDMALALSWVKDNIAAFGGNPKDIVPFGQDAGAMAIGVFLASATLRLSLGITKAILSSGSLLAPPRHPPTQAAWKQFLESLGCDLSDTAVFACLASKTSEDLVKAQELHPGVVGMTFPDDDVLEDAPSVVLARGVDLRGVQLLLANTLNEGDLIYDRTFGGRENVSIREVLDSVRVAIKEHVVVDTSEMIEEIERLYIKSRSSRRNLAADVLGDVFYNCPAVFLSALACSAHAQVKHVVLASRPDGWGNWTRFRAGSTHNDDLPLVFGVPLWKRSPTDQDADEAYSKKIILLWTDFAKDGTVALQKFPSRCVGHKRKSVALLRARDRVIENWRHQQCDFFNRYFDYDGTAGAHRAARALLHHP